MTTGVILGILVIVVSALFLLGNLVTAYRTQGGAIGQVPVMAFPVFLPAFASFFLGIINRDAGWPGWPVWSIVVLWLATTAVAWWATIQAGNLGARNAASEDGGVDPRNADDDTE